MNTQQPDPPIPPVVTDQAAEHEAAKQRILELAEAERIPVEETTRVRGRRGRS
ncbi:hypothetical protein ABT336_18630 [Micromonospora sp. NPDC000207]|uniref:hypothetical protein n=1 Tax=Micromonospora sp. NPDC000207 TaxID=3154246 RepID=UPI00331EAFD5